jgi:hypothetical protein
MASSILYTKGGVDLIYFFDVSLLHMEASDFIGMSSGVLLILFYLPGMHVCVYMCMHIYMSY